MSSSRGSVRLTVAAGLLLLGFAALAAINTAALAASGGATGTDVSFVALLVVVAAVSGRSLHRGARWAWWIALALAVVGLFFVAPVTGTILLGGSLEPVGTGWDVAFFPLMTIDLGALVVVLWKVRGRQGRHTEPTQDHP